MPALSKYGGYPEISFEGTGYFRLEETDDRWWLVDPDGNAFVSVGLNHTDPTDLKYPHNIEVWEEKYGSREAWLKEGLGEDLDNWGFNTLGWTGQYISGGWRDEFDWSVPTNVTHSDGLSLEEIESLDIPYTLNLRIAETEDWNGNPWFPDPYSGEFDEYCSFLARRICDQVAESENLIGYYFVDAPAWKRHVTGEDFERLEGLDEDEREEELVDIADKYYRTITKHIRNYDTNHLILGDRLNGDKGTPDSVIDVASEYIDVLSVQYFPGPAEESRRWMREDMQRLYERTGKPIMVPDIGSWCPTHLNPNRSHDPTGETAGMASHADRGQHYVDSIGEIIDQPWFLGFQWCSYIENSARGWGLKSTWDEPYEDFVGPISDFNETLYDRAQPDS